MGGPGSGRKKLPAHILKLRGSRIRKDDNTVAPAEGEPKKPPHTVLGDYGSALWDEIVPYFVEWQYAGSADTTALTAMCIWWDVFRRNIDEDNLKAADKAFMKYDRIASKYGYTAADRARLKIDSGPTRQSGVMTRKREEGA